MHIQVYLPVSQRHYRYDGLGGMPFFQIGNHCRYVTTGHLDGLITIVRQGPIVGYYAGRPYLFLFPRPFEENMQILRESDYVVVDAVEFWQQTPEQTETVLQYIEDNFTVDQTLKDDGGQITVYRRNSQ